MTRAVALVALLCGCTSRALVVPGPGDGSRDFSVANHDLGAGDLAGADLTGADLAGADRAGADLAGAGGGDMATAPLPQTRGASVGTGIVVLAADLDGDGNSDLVVIEAAGTVRIYTGDGTGNLFPRQSFEINTDTTLASGVLADVDGDGVLDLVLAEPGPAKSEVDVLRGNGDATFADWSRTLVAGGVQSVAIGDLNGDGVPDLVAVTQDDLLHVLQGQAAGKPRLLVPTYSVGQGSQEVMLFDDDGDGDLDAVIADRDGNVVLFLQGDGMTGFSAGASAAAPNDASRLVLGDWDGDGIPDVGVLGRASSMSVSDVTVDLLFGDGSGGVRATTQIGTSLVAKTGNDGLAAGDMNDDGNVDLVMSGDATARLVIARGDGVGDFAQLPAIGLDEAAIAIALADFDGDGYLDVAAAGVTKTQLYLTQP